MSISISNKEEFISVMERVQEMPEESDHITAYGAGPEPEENEDGNQIMDEKQMT